MTAYGHGMGLAAIALEVLERRPTRLVWFVDMQRDVGPDADDLLDPSNPMKSETKWGAILGRLRAHLDAQPHEGQECRIALHVRHKLRSSGEPVGIVFYLPWAAKVSFVAVAKPPVGTWYLEHQPEVDRLSGLCKGDQLPDSFFFDGIPF